MLKHIIIILLSLLSFQTFAQEENPYEAYKVKWIGKPAPDFKYKDISGKEFFLSDLRGKVVLMGIILKNSW